MGKILRIETDGRMHKNIYRGNYCLIFYLFIKHELRDPGIPGIIRNFGYKDELDMGPAF